MNDAERTIEDLEDLSEHLFHEYRVCASGDQDDCYMWYLCAVNALTLLREQDERIRDLVAEADEEYRQRGRD